ncbi:hypothetical protein CJC78_28215 [Escherichia coli]|nr:hypothetical protein [Escherichia coli]
METVFDALKAMGKASSQEVAARLGMTRDEAINELWKLKRRGWADNKGPMWWLTNEKSDENDLILPSLHMANRELRRAKSHVQKWERVCAALRELNKYRDIVAQLCQEATSEQD